MSELINRRVRIDVYDTGSDFTVKATDHETGPVATAGGTDLHRTRFQAVRLLRDYIRQFSRENEDRHD